MTIQDVCITPLVAPADRPVLDLPVLNDPSTNSEVIARASFHQSKAAAERAPAVGIQAFPGDSLVHVNAYLHCKFSELRQQTRQYRRSIESYIAFSRELLAGPRTVGALCPSSPCLAQAMAEEVGGLDGGLVLELGAGTGSITSALLQQGVAPEQLIVIELSATLAAHLRQRFPAIRVIEGDARQLNALLGNDAGRVRAIVSGLPLRSLARTVVTEITQQIRRLLPENGVFVQFTYDLSKPSFSGERALRRARTRVIWKNLPPARVDTFVREPDGLHSSPVS